MRDNMNYCLISCGPNGENGEGGHCHNDKLSFELCIDGEDVVVDPGTYMYTSDPENRNKFRSTACHNTIMIDGEEQNPIRLDKLFQLKDKTRAKCIKWEIGENADVFEGCHYGYTHLKDPIVHYRSMVFDKNTGSLQITDTLDGKGRHKAEENLVMSSLKNKTVDLYGDNINWQKVQAEYSPEYGIFVETKKYKATIRLDGKTEINFCLKKKQ